MIHDDEDLAKPTSGGPPDYGAPRAPALPPEKRGKKKQAPPDLGVVDADAPAHFERGDHVELAELTLSALGSYPLTYDAGEFWRYAPSRGIWEQVSGALVRTTAASFAGCPVGFGREQKPLKVNANAALGAEQIARDKLQAAPERVVFAGAPTGMAFSNGFVVVTGGKVTLEEHAPEHRARHAYPFSYERVPTPELDAFLEAIFADCAEAERADRIALVQEFVGACLIGEATRYQRCLVLFAEGGNGKSELLRILRGVFPSESVTSLAPQRWGDRFRLALLASKLANFVDELPEAEILAGESFKAVVTGEPIDAERKHRDPFTFASVAGHIFNTNSPISTADHTEGFWRRPLILPLSRSFETDPERRLQAGQAVLDAELPGVVAWAIEGAARVQQQGGYTVPAQSKAVAKQWRDESDVVRLFAAVQPWVEEVSAAELYGRYKAWTKENGYGQMSIQKFGRRLTTSKLYSKEERAPGVFYVRHGQR